MVNAVFFFIAMFLLWTGLVFPLTTQEAIIGALISLVITIMFSSRLREKESLKLSRIYHFIMFSFVFIKELIVANLAMAKIVVTPALPISPKIVKIETSLKSKVGRALLANAITLTPGTLSVDLEDNVIFIHVVDGKALGNDYNSIAKPFEKYLKGAFDR